MRKAITCIEKPYLSIHVDYDYLTVGEIGNLLIRLQALLRSLAELSRGRTTLIIAHRLSTIRYASRIVVMDKGRVTDMGTHDELLKRCELYKVLCETQLAG